mmetsp:Transcript_61968/g.146760  ORF Transcript_61968/g.146760 Transcript_61968/m.146760 type:complete len:225 (+) Transcript_61968:193-867(+)
MQPTPEQYAALAAQQQAEHQQQLLQQQWMQAAYQQQQAEQQQPQVFAAAGALGAPPTVLCCTCGTAIEWNPSNMCVNCLRGRVDIMITEGIPKQAVVHWCRNCGRYLQPPKNWIPANLESKELLTLLIKRLRGLNKVKLVDASFIWTEPHSKRLKIKLTIQKEVFNSTILQQAFIVEYIVENLQCDACKRVGADQHWKAVVQVRQRANGAADSQVWGARALHQH